MPESAFGYTARETEWLRHVLLHAGVFLRRQYLAFIGNHGRGAVDQRFLGQLCARRHAIAERYHDREIVFHLTSKALYEWVGEPDLRHRRHLPPHRLAQKLMLLDLFIDERRRHHRWLVTEEDKVRFCRVERGVPDAALPQRLYRSAHDPLRQTTRYFVDRYTVVITAEHRVGLVYPDFSGHPEAFRDFVAAHRGLLLALPASEIVYLTGRGLTADRAEAHCRRHFAPAMQQDATLVLAELMQFCMTRQALYEHRPGALAKADYDHLNDWVCRFGGREFEADYAAWRAGGPAALVASFQASPVAPAPMTFRHVALPHNYYCLGRDTAAPRRSRRHSPRDVRAIVTRQGQNREPNAV